MVMVFAFAHMEGCTRQSCARSVMLYGSETWAVKEADLLRLKHNDMRIIRWMCNITLKDRNPSSELSECLGLDRIRDCIRKGRLILFGHVERCSDNVVMKKCRNIVVEWQQKKKRP